MTVRIDKKDDLWTVVIHRPDKRNAVDRSTADALTQAFDDFDADEDALVAVLYGEGGNFCAGADLKAVAEGRPNLIDPDGDGPLGPTRKLVSKPVIAAVEGHAVAGGLELAIWCDMRVASENAVFGVFCRRFGVPLLDGGTVRLPRLIGHSRAMDMILTGRPIDASEALAIGLANRVVPAGQTRAAAEELAGQIASFPQLCMRADRMSAYEQWSLSVGAALANEARESQEVLEKESFPGAARFAGGAGRHGRFE